jgi:hypothetical protein
MTVPPWSRPVRAAPPGGAARDDAPHGALPSPFSPTRGVPIDASGVTTAFNDCAICTYVCVYQRNLIILCWQRGVRAGC